MAWNVKFYRGKNQQEIGPYNKTIGPFQDNLKHEDGNKNEDDEKKLGQPQNEENIRVIKFVVFVSTNQHIWFNMGPYLLHSKYKKYYRTFIPKIWDIQRKIIGHCPLICRKKYL